MSFTLPISMHLFGIAFMEAIIVHYRNTNYEVREHYRKYDIRN